MSKADPEWNPLHLAGRCRIATTGDRHRGGKELGLAGHYIEGSKTAHGLPTQGAVEGFSWCPNEAPSASGVKVNSNRKNLPKPAGMLP